MWIEVPVTPRLLQSLRAAVPRPAFFASLAGGPYHRRSIPSAAAACLTAHLTSFKQTLIDCGWKAAEDRRVSLHGQAYDLVWPWEWTDAPDASDPAAAAEATVYPFTPTDDGDRRADRPAVRLPYEWATAAFESYVHSVASVQVFMAHRTRRHVGAEDPSVVDAFVSRLTDPVRHRLFASLRSKGASVTSLDATGASRFLCHASMAASTSGGLMRFFVPGAETALTHLQGFVSGDPSILMSTTVPTAAQAARGGVLFVPRPELAGAERNSENHRTTSLAGVTTGLSTTELCHELGLPALPRSLTADSLRRYGVLPSATCRCWSYRLAFLQALSDAARREIHYTEAREECEADSHHHAPLSHPLSHPLSLSPEMLVFTPGSPVVRKPLVWSSPCLLLLWTGRWACRYS